MQRLRGFFYLFLLFGSFSVESMAQITATASASACIVAPLGISKAVDLDFGNVGAGAANGIVKLNPDGSREQTGGASLPSVSGTVTAASFTVTGEPDCAYYIMLPGALTLSNGAENMTVDSFSSNPVSTGTIGPAGSQTLTVGASLNVDAMQPLGDYISLNEFPVTINYN